MKNIKTSVAVLFALIAVVAFGLFVTADYEDGMECPVCGAYRYDDWIVCDDCGLCIDCADDYTCPVCEGCTKCAGAVCNSCGACADCAEIICDDCGNACFNCADESEFCQGCNRCGECNGTTACPGCHDNCSECNDEFCTNCNYCSNCTDIICSECGNACFHCADDSEFCIGCGRCGECNGNTSCPGCRETCGECEARDFCSECFYCEDCGEMICTECGKACFNCSDDSEFCIGCGRCGECNGNTSCPGCRETCGECEARDFCSECFYCEDCGEMICTECGKACFNCSDDSEFCIGCGRCGECNGNTSCPGCRETCGECEARDFCSECFYCEDCGEMICTECGKACFNCADDSEFCIGCGRCGECNGNTSCPGCRETCGECESKDFCSECFYCEDCGEMICTECGKACFNCSDDSEFCVGCGRCGDCNGNTSCPGCRESCGECEAKNFCGECFYCEDCGEIICSECGTACFNCADDSEFCVGCNRCGDCNGSTACEGCRETCFECTDQSEFCSNCGACPSCNGGSTCPDCGATCLECGNIWQCTDCFKCADCTTLCQSCEDICYDCADGWCQGCGICGDCSGNTICPDCGETCLECKSINQCTDCYSCANCTTICSNCGEMCCDCTSSWCESCETCGECNNDTACPICGETCMECANIYQCVDCYTCTDCTSSFCSNCETCGDCNGNTVCPGCGETCLSCENVSQCRECYLCADCVTICGDCAQVCIDCADGWCLNCGECGDCKEICTGCNEICSDCTSGWCDHCMTCGDCNGDSVCQNCGSSCESCGNLEQCQGCRTCEFCADICIICGDYCSVCDSDYNEQTHLCSNCDIHDVEAAAVMALIENIGSIEYTPECKAKIDAATAGYNALSSDQKQLVTNYGKLRTAQRAYAYLKAQKDQSKANMVINGINNIGEVGYNSASYKRIAVARKFYSLLTADQKALVTNYDVLVAAEARYDELKALAHATTADVAAANSVITKINAIGTVTYTDACCAKIQEARNAYNSLTADQKPLVTNYNTLTAAEATYAGLKAQANQSSSDKAAANAVTAKITAIGTVEYTPSSKAKIDEARAAYNALTNTQKDLVGNYSILTAAESKYAKLKADADQLAVDQTAVNAATAKINAIGTVVYTDSCKAKIDDARNTYNSLTINQKSSVTNYDVLTAAEAKYAELKAAADKAAADKAAADGVTAKINAIGTVEYTKGSKDKIDKARTAYNLLTSEQKAIVTNYNTLTAAEAKYAELKAAADKSAADKAVADTVIAKINAIGSVEYTSACKAKIDEARNAYNALTSDQKAFVTNYSTLTTAESKYAGMKAASDQAVADQASADAVKAKINSIGTVEYTSASKAKIDEARNAYNALTAKQKALVTNYGTLTAAESKYAELKSAADDKIAAKSVVDKIDAIGTVTYSVESKSKINDAKVAYKALSASQKDLVTNYPALASAEQTYDQLKAQAEVNKTVKSVSLGGNKNLSYKSSLVLTPQITADEGASYTVTYNSSNNSVATVDGSGKVTSVKQFGFGRGSTVITVTVTDSYGNTVTDSITVTVNYVWWQWVLKIVLFGWLWY